MAESNHAPITSDSSDTLVGKVLNSRFTVLERIGSGGMGRVYKAMQSPLDRLCALKILNPSYSVEQDPAFAKRFFLEASVTSKLTHPNTITIFDYGRTDEGIFFIAMEYLQGRTLHQAVVAEGNMSAPRVVHIARQICRALREAHSLGIVHRDLKPANVMLLHHGDDEDFVKVLDFGLVKFFTEQPDRSPDEAELTQGGVFLGSPTYMAPEQARNHADPRSDVYSLGVVSYHLLAGRPPFTGKAPVDIILKHVNEPPPPFRPELKVPPDLEAVIMRSLAKNPDDRFQTMDAFLEALKRVGTLSPSDLLFQSAVHSAPHGKVPTGPQRSRPGPPVASSPSLPSARLRQSQAQPVLAPEEEDVPLTGPTRPPAWKLPAIIGGSVTLGAIALIAVVALNKPPPEPPKIITADPVQLHPHVDGAPTAQPSKPASLTLKVNSVPTGADVASGDNVLGKTPLEISIDPGKLSNPPVLKLSASGYAPLEVPVEKEGDVLTAHGELKHLEADANANIAPTPQVNPPKKISNNSNSSNSSKNNKKQNSNKPSGYKDDPYQ